MITETGRSKNIVSVLSAVISSTKIVPSLYGARFRFSVSVFLVSNHYYAVSVGWRVWTIFSGRQLLTRLVLNAYFLRRQHSLWAP